MQTTYIYITIIGHRRSRVIIVGARPWDRWCVVKIAYLYCLSLCDIFI